LSRRRRHTRSKRDWSSDVCSSDLKWRKKNRNANASKKPHRTLQRLLRHHKPVRTKIPTSSMRTAMLPEQQAQHRYIVATTASDRSEERRVGKESQARVEVGHKERE